MSRSYITSRVVFFGGGSKPPDDGRWLMGPWQAGLVTGRSHYHRNCYAYSGIGELVHVDGGNRDKGRHAICVFPIGVCLKKVARSLPTFHHCQHRQYSKEKLNGDIPSHDGSRAWMDPDERRLILKEAIFYVSQRTRRVIIEG